MIFYVKKKSYPTLSSFRRHIFPQKLFVFFTFNFYSSLNWFFWSESKVWILFYFVFLYGCTLSCFSHVQLFVTPWTITRQAPLSTGFSRQEYWSGLPCPPPGDLPNPGIEPTSHVSPDLQAYLFTTEPLRKPSFMNNQSLLCISSLIWNATSS